MGGRRGDRARDHGRRPDRPGVRLWPDARRGPRRRARLVRGRRPRASGRLRRLHRRVPEHQPGARRPLSRLLGGGARDRGRVWRVRPRRGGRGPRSGFLGAAPGRGERPSGGSSGTGAEHPAVARARQRGDGVGRARARRAGSRRAAPDDARLAGRGARGGRRRGVVQRRVTDRAVHRGRRRGPNRRHAGHDRPGPACMGTRVERLRGRDRRRRPRALRRRAPAPAAGRDRGLRALLAGRHVHLVRRAARVRRGARPRGARARVRHRLRGRCRPAARRGGRRRRGRDGVRPPSGRRPARDGRAGRVRVPLLHGLAPDRPCAAGRARAARARGRAAANARERPVPARTRLDRKRARRPRLEG